MDPLAAFSKYCLLTLVFCLHLATATLAQLQNGQITGAITDPTGASVAHAIVHIQNPATGYEIDVESDAAGFYDASELAVGTYTLRVEFSGFKNVIARNLVLEAGGALRVDFRLALGRHSETVEVSDAARFVNTEDSRLTYTVSSSQIANLPLNGRNVYDLVQYQPGATNMRGILFENGANSVVNGIRENFSGFLMNGAPNTGLSGGPVNQPILDSVEEFQVSTLNNSAEIGSSAGPITNVVTKSGTNQIHGAAWEFLRNDLFDANYFFANASEDPADRKKLPLRLNQFGGTLGAPIKKDKLFFFAAYQGERFVGSSPQQVVTESAEFRQATIAAFPNSVAALLYSSFPPLANGKPLATLRESIDQHFDHFFSFAEYLCPANTDGRTPMSGLIAHKFAALFGVEQADINQLNANCPGGSPFSTPLTGSFNRDTNIFDVVLDRGNTQVQDNLFDGNEAALRLDYNISQASRIFTQFNWARSKNKYNNASVRGFSSPSTRITPNFQFSFLHTFTPNLLNEFRVGYARNRGSDSVPLPGVPSVNLDVEGFGSREGVPDDLKENIYNVGDSLSILRGRHNLKLGVDLRRNREDNDLNAGRPGYFFFDSLFFAIDAPVAEDVGVDPGFSSGIPAHLETNVRHWRNWYAGLYIKDDWKLSRRLAINIGLRYDLYSVSKERNGLATTFIKGPGGSIIDNITTGAGQIKDASAPCPGDPRATLAGECGPGGFSAVKKLGGEDHNNLGPRAGFAWDIFGDGKSSLRGGYAVSYEGSLQKRLSLTRWNLPYYSLNTITNFLDSNPDGRVVYGPVNGGSRLFLALHQPLSMRGVECKLPEIFPVGIR